MKTFCETSAAALGVVLSFFFGSLDGILASLAVIAAVDYVTGVLVAITRHELSSRVGFKGICKKILIFCLVGVAHLIDINLLGGKAFLRDGAIFFYFANEGISIIENAIELDLPVPEALKNIMLKMRENTKDGVLEEGTKR